MKAYDIQDSFFLKDVTVQDGNYALKSIDIYVNGEYYILSPKAVDLSCQDFSDKLILSSTTSYCNHNNIYSICFNSQIINTNTDLSRYCGNL
jgi:hypothetical protein